MKGGLHPADSSCIPPPFAGFMGIPLNTLPFMPTFTPSSSGLEVLAPAALAQLPSTQGDGVPPILSTEPTNPGVLNIPGFTSVPTKLIQRIWGLEYVDMWELLPKTWQQEAAQSSTCCHSRRPKRGLITNIALWTECFTTLSGQSSPPHGTPLDNSKGHIMFTTYTLFR